VSLVLRSVPDSYSLHASLSFAGIITVICDAWLFGGDARWSFKETSNEQHSSINRQFLSLILRSCGTCCFRSCSWVGASVYILPSGSRAFTFSEDVGQLPFRNVSMLEKTSSGASIQDM
jgi:hypothetical protein